MREDRRSSWGSRSTPSARASPTPRPTRSSRRTRPSSRRRGGYALPTLWIGETQIVGAQPAEKLEEALNGALARAGS